VTSLDFKALLARIGEVDRAAVLAVGRQAQQALSLRNWLVGAWIVAFEQGGQDRAAYGERLIGRLAASLKQGGARGMSARNLANFRRVALAYPTLDARALGRVALPQQAGGATWLAPAQSEAGVEILQAPARSSDTPSGLPWRDSEWVQRLFRDLTFTHLVEFSRMEDSLERAFYELHCLEEGWATRELIRQRSSMLYQRVGLSTERDRVVALARDGRVDQRSRALVRDPYVLEFLGLPGTSVDEASLEQALLDNLQGFLLELGREFCFVARQYRITLGNRHHHLDLLFFHRRLRCLVAVDLKTTAFSPDHAGQMRFYLNFLAGEVALPDENPPIGILLCAGKDEEVVQFATAGDDDVLVSRYLLELPSRDQLAQWLHEARAAAEVAIAQTRATGEE